MKLAMKFFTDNPFLTPIWPTSSRVWMPGRMVWDGDGIVEIHPRNAAEVAPWVLR